MVVFGSASVEMLSQVLAKMAGAVMATARRDTRVMKYSSRPVYQWPLVAYNMVRRSHV
jgi:hypothetical protein